MRKRTLLRVLRAVAEPKLSQHRLALRAGMGLSRYWQIENGVGYPPTAAERQAIADGLGVSTSEIAWPEFERAVANG